LRNIGADYEIIGFSEIDKYAIKSYIEIHGDIQNYGDVTTMKCIPKCDIFTWGFPCQDLSLAGKQKGMEEGTRSNLGYKVIDLIKQTKEKPKLLIMENVPPLAQKKFYHHFEKMQKELNDLGYRNYWQILNAKDYGIPQNRKRVFMISILGEYNYEFPTPKPLTKKLKDLLEDEVDEKYYLSDKMIKCLTDTTNRNGLIRAKLFRPHNPNKSSTAYTVTTKAGSRPTDNFIEVFDFRYDEGARGRVDSHCSPTLTTKVGTSGISGQPLLKIPKVTKKGVMPTLTTRPDVLGGTIKQKGLRIRKLTPKECWRLMGFSDEDFEKAQKVNSDSQLYKQAGNSIVVKVLEEMFKKMF
jgi:DNA (cytosine-5)-methyltransferase 1